MNPKTNRIDVHIQDHGTIFLFCPLTPAAKAWADEHIDPDHQTWAGGIVVEHRFIRALAEGAIADGLVVR